MALGGAYAVTASGALGVWSNPAAVARIMAREASVAATSLSADRKVVLAALALGRKRDGWFFGMRWCGVSDIQGYGADGRPGETFGAGDAVLAAGYAKALTPLTFVGVRANLLTSYLDDERAWGASTDAGFLYMPLPPLLKVGAVIRDLGAFSRWSGYDDMETTAATIRAGLAIGLFQGKVSLNTELEQVLDGSPLTTLLGLQLKAGRGFVVRGGLRGRYASFGIGVAAGRATFDFAMMEDALEVRPVSCISLSVGL